MGCTTHWPVSQFPQLDRSVAWDFTDLFRLSRNIGCIPIFSAPASRTRTRPSSSRFGTTVTSSCRGPRPTVTCMGEIFSVRGSSETHNLVIEPPRPQDLPLFSHQELHLAPEAWKSLLAAGNLVCAKTSQGEFAGVCVANHYSLLYNGDQLRSVEAALNVLCNRFKLAETNIAFGLQAVIASKWQSSDLRGHLLRELLRSIGLRYRHLFSFCRKDNLFELHSLELEGWRCFQEEDEVCYFMLETAKALRGLASQLVLRIPPRPSPSMPRATGTQ